MELIEFALLSGGVSVALLWLYHNKVLPKFLYGFPNKKQVIKYVSKELGQLHKPLVAEDLVKTENRVMNMGKDLAEVKQGIGGLENRNNGISERLEEAEKGIKDLWELERRRKEAKKQIKKMNEAKKRKKEALGGKKKPENVEDVLKTMSDLEKKVIHLFTTTELTQQKIAIRCMTTQQNISAILKKHKKWIKKFRKHKPKNIKD